MDGTDGIWFCANFLGDSFELTSFDDGALLMQMVRKRLRRRGGAIRLEPCSEGCWEAMNQVRLRRCGKHMLLQQHREGKWGSEVQAFRDSLVATASYFRDFARKGNQTDSPKEFMIRKSTESSAVFKVEPFDVETAFKTKVSWECAPSMDEPEECKICMENEADVVLMPCGHSGLCELCVWQIISQKKSVSCPFCRQPISKIAKVEARASCQVLTDKNMRTISDLAGKPRPAWT